MLSLLCPYVPLFVHDVIMPVYESVSVWRVLPVLFCRSVPFVSAFSFVLSLSRQCNQRQPCLPAVSSLLRSPLVFSVCVFPYSVSHR